MRITVVPNHFHIDPKSHLMASTDDIYHFKCYIWKINLWIALISDVISENPMFIWIIIKSDRTIWNPLFVICHVWNEICKFGYEISSLNWFLTHFPHKTWINPDQSLDRQITFANDHFICMSSRDFTTAKYDRTLGCLLIFPDLWCCDVDVDWLVVVDPDLMNFESSVSISFSTRVKEIWLWFDGRLSKESILAELMKYPDNNPEIWADP
jgi:hypothetical protein